MIGNRAASKMEHYLQHPEELRRPTNKVEYSSLVDILQELVDKYNWSVEPAITLFRTTTKLIGEWEEENLPEEWLNPSVAPWHMLEYLMDEFKVTRSVLADEMSISQASLSRILKGSQVIGPDLAEKLAKRFNASPDMFTKTNWHDVAT